MKYIKQLTLADLLVLIGAGILIVSLYVVSPLYALMGSGIVLLVLGLPGVYGR